ncbi:MAG: flippase-like domain-containing protein, partial [Deltaproteobacteria bacterium]|nr:flippase-like domain-containing protein [Deltaproteobacteria bacterium]
AWYVAGEEPTRKTRAVFTLLLDRAIGLFVVIAYAAGTLLFVPQWLDEHAELRILSYSLWGMTAAAILLGSLFLIPWHGGFVHFVRSAISPFGFINQIANAMAMYNKKFVCIVAALTLSAISILGTTVLYCLQGNALGISVSLSQYFFIVPLGLTVSAVPLLPAGIGVGQVAFFTLFKWVGISNPEQGATLCTLLQIHILLFNLLGGFFFLRYQKGIAHRPYRRYTEGIPKTPYV